MKSLCPAISDLSEFRINYWQKTCKMDHISSPDTAPSNGIRAFRRLPAGWHPSQGTPRANPTGREHSSSRRLMHTLEVNPGGQGHHTTGRARVAVLSVPRQLPSFRGAAASQKCWRSSTGSGQRGERWKGCVCTVRAAASVEVELSGTRARRGANTFSPCQAKHSSNDATLHHATFHRGVGARRPRGALPMRCCGRPTSRHTR